MQNQADNCTLLEHVKLAGRRVSGR